MQRLVFLVFLAFLVLPIYGQQEIELSILLANLRSEIAFTTDCLLSTRNELNQTKLFLKGLLLKNAAEQILLQNRIEFLETESNRLAEEKNRLETDYKRLSESGDLSTKLKQEFGDYKSSAEKSIATWKGIAIITGIAAIAVTVWKLATK